MGRHGARPSPLIVTQYPSDVARLPIVWNWGRPRRGPRGDQPLMIKERPAIGGVEEIVAKRVLLRQLALR